MQKKDYKKGDIVVIRTDLSEDVAYDGGVECTDAMVVMGGQVHVIHDVREARGGAYNIYELESDTLGWNWTYDMFEELDEKTLFKALHQEKITTSAYERMMKAIATS